MYVCTCKVLKFCMYDFLLPQDSDSIAPVEDMEMATIVKPEFSDPPEDVQNGGSSSKKGPSRLLAESQAAVLNTAGLITEDGLKHSESFDLPPNISLHQVC